jgi:hypothetical protein
VSEFVHYWTGYGNLCMTADGRRGDAQCSAERSEVTCERCLKNLAAIDAQGKDVAVYGSGYLRRDADGSMTHVPLQDVQVTTPNTRHE